MNIQTVPQLRAVRRDTADKRAVIVPLIAFAMVSATLAFVPSRPLSGNADASVVIGPAGLPPRASPAAVPMPERLRLPSYRRPPLPTFSAFAAGLARETPPAIATRVAREFMKEPKLAEAWDQFAQTPDAPAQAFVGHIAALPEFRKLMSQFSGEPGFREAFFQLARKPEIDGVLKAALLPLPRTNRVPGGAGGMGSRTIHSATRVGYSGASTARGGVSETIGSGVPHALAPVPAVGEWREAAAAGTLEPAVLSPDASAFGARRGDGLDLNATPRPLSAPPSQDVKVVRQPTPKATEPSKKAETRERGFFEIAGGAIGALDGGLLGAAIGMKDGPAGLSLGWDNGSKAGREAGSDVGRKIDQAVSGAIHWLFGS